MAYNYTAAVLISFFYWAVDWWDSLALMDVLVASKCTGLTGLLVACRDTGTTTVPVTSQAIFQCFVSSSLRTSACHGIARHWKKIENVKSFIQLFNLYFKHGWLEFVAEQEPTPQQEIGDQITNAYS